MPFAPLLSHDLAAIAGVAALRNEPLSRHTRFGIGGPASLYVECASEAGFLEALSKVQASGSPHVVVGNGTNLIVADAGYDGVVLRLTEARVEGGEDGAVRASAGALLQDLVDFTIARGLAGLHVMTGIPGSVGAAVYGNAGAYGRSIAGAVEQVRFFDGARVLACSNAECGFGYRESTFKRNKQWIILSVSLRLESGDAGELKARADGILEIRNRKYPPTMKCAGSIFKNLLLADLPPAVQGLVPEKTVIEGKVPSAWFLEQVGAKGMSDGDIRVADYHANLIYNEGSGTAAQLRRIIGELKRRVAERFGFSIEEEVQYIGF